MTIRRKTSSDNEVTIFGGDGQYGLEVSLDGSIANRNLVYDIYSLSWVASIGGGASNGSIATNYSEITQISGNYVYTAKALIGSQTQDAVWQVSRTDTTGPIVTAWADGNDNFDNIATDLTGLTYS